MLDDRDIPIMDRSRARRAAHDAPDPPRPGPIAGPPRPLRVPPAALGAVVAVLAVAALVLLPGLLTPPARPALDPTAPTAHPSIPVAGAAAQAAPIVPSPAPLATLADGSIAYAAPDGATLGDVSGRAVGELLELYVLDAPSPRGAMWVRASVEGAGLVWLPLGALSGQAVELAGLPCRGTCVSPSATAAPVYVAPAPAPAHVVEAAPPDAIPVESHDRPTPALPPGPAPTTCPIVMTPQGCGGNMVEVKP